MKTRPRQQVRTLQELIAGLAVKRGEWTSTSVEVASDGSLSSLERLETLTVEEAQLRLYDALQRRSIQALDNVCVHCNGMGTVTLDFPVGHRWFGRAWKCICSHLRDEAIRRQQAEQERQMNCGIDELYRGFDLDGFRQMGVLDGKEEAYKMCCNMAQGLPPTLEGKVRPGLYLHGEFGTGKTGLAMAVLNARLAVGIKVHAIDFRTFLGVVQDTYSNNQKGVTRQGLITQAANAELLLLDDMGDKERSKPITDDQRDITYMLIQARYLSQRPTIITTNLTGAEFMDQFGTRIGHRVFERCEVCKVGGDVLRS